MLLVIAAMCVMIIFSFADGIVHIFAADWVWQILHAAVCHGAIEEFFVVITADGNVNFSQARWQAEGTVDVELAFKIVHALFMHELWQAGIGNHFTMQVILFAGRNWCAAIENGVRNGMSPHRHPHRDTG